MSELRLIRLQAAAGAVFLVFVVIHLANTMAAAVGMEAYNELQRSARAFYQNPFVEIAGLALPLLIHLSATFCGGAVAGCAGRRSLRAHVSTPLRESSCLA